MRCICLLRFLTAAICLSFCLLAPAAPTPATPTPGLAPERTKNGTALLKSFRAVAALTVDSVVELEVNGQTVALGAVVRNDGQVVTKSSELTEGILTCRLPSGQHAPARIINVDDDNDLALVQVQATGLKPLQWAAQDVHLGQWAVTPGIETIPAAVGIISAAPRRILPKRAVIGVVPDFSAATARVREVMPGLGAEKAGLQSGDTILSVNEQSVSSGAELVNVLRQYRDGQTVTIQIERLGERLSFDIRMSTPKPEGLRRPLDRQERMNRLGTEISRRAEGFQLAIQHDTVLQPWQCGGPLVNLEGQAIGLNIARAGRIASYALPANLVLKLVNGLQTQPALPVKSERSPIRPPA